MYFAFPIVSPTVVQVKKCALWYLLVNSSLLILYYMMIRYLDVYNGLNAGVAFPNQILVSKIPNPVNNIR